MKTKHTKRWELIESNLIKGEFRIHDNLTSEAALFTTKSECLKRIKRKFKKNLCSTAMFYFDRHLSIEDAAKIKSMLPNTTLR
jgi:hypothetical protein